MQLYCPSIDANVHVSIIGYLIARRFFPRAREEIDYPSVRPWRRSAVPIHPLLRYVTWPTVRPFHGPRDCAITLPGQSQTHGETNERNTDSSRETGKGRRERRYVKFYHGWERKTLASRFALERDEERERERNKLAGRRRSDFQLGWTFSSGETGK